ncbi:MAG TPA: 6,7-dimethyl-8-ribityllumazine synthase [Gaiellaceae bacterium]|nr:6,7-dimethyl-8-ribityllumazine synthase [Gaiellaceae bacterium]
MSEEHWPGEDRLTAPEQEELGPEVPEDEVELAPGEEELAEAEAQPAPPGEQVDGDSREEEPGDDTEAPEEPAEEDELPRLRPPGHAAGDLSIPDGYGVIAGSADGGRRAVGVVVSRYNGEVTNRLLESALAELELAGVVREAVTIVQVPGAFELPLGAMALAKTRRYACIVALGCVIRGETPHFDYIASETASGLQLAALETGIPVSFGVLTLESGDQADDRVGKGAEAVRTALEMADLFSRLRTQATA